MEKIKQIEEKSPINKKLCLQSNCAAQVSIVWCIAQSAVKLVIAFDLCTLSIANWCWHVLHFLSSFYWLWFRFLFVFKRPFWPHQIDANAPQLSPIAIWSIISTSLAQFIHDRADSFTRIRAAFCDVITEKYWVWTHFDLKTKYWHIFFSNLTWKKPILTLKTKTLTLKSKTLTLKNQILT